MIYTPKHNLTPIYELNEINIIGDKQKSYVQNNPEKILEMLLDGDDDLFGTEPKYILTKNTSAFKTIEYNGKQYGYCVRDVAGDTVINAFEYAPKLFDSDEFKWKDGTENSMTAEFRRNNFEFRCIYREREDTLYIRVYYTKGVDRLKDKGRKRKIDTIEIDNPTNRDIDYAINQWVQEFTDEINNICA